MSEDNLYVDQFKAWCTEQELLLKQINYDIEISKRKIELNEKQKQLHLERVNIGIQEFNNWAKTSNRDERLELLKEDQTDAATETLFCDGQEFATIHRKNMKEDE
ncbi:hypothetical protein P8818_09155 [Bacillus velezensis]|uniref:hypothetical protein n=1 Tax=Bacillus amyloliquefaciens group TaxID=1938374 RepID=UPI0002AAE067|nr:MULTISPECIES: hypothetical protein [Bacillus amyloliquefaciens group]APA01904.1 hypothetical protein BK055_04905 [Bacillus velezensis]MCM8508114.1 hypothetical protein [Bacillus amyloliquefaciens]MCZ4248016.1 hypothetical protein [Bacillus amyloliquefaciens]MEC0387765.1 hypothetical protein [Bacillus velezensis]UBM13942.1 hypothetical protein LAZ96_14975 [Bacillus velezensis]